LILFIFDMSKSTTGANSELFISDMTAIKSWLTALTLAALAGIAHAQTPASTSATTPAQSSDSQSLTAHSEFAGPYAGIKVGGNWSDASGVVNRDTHGTAFFGAMAGYGFDVGRFVLGAEAFADLHGGSTTKDDGGLDLRFGMPFNKIMPYARIGFTSAWPDTRLHGGLGVEYAIYKNIHISGEWTADRSNSNGTKRTNNSFTVGVTYYFR
jgi:outer membrane immunogenic protein